MITKYPYLACYQVSQRPHFPACTQSDGSTSHRTSAEERDQIPKPSLNSVLNTGLDISVSSLNAAVGRKIFSSSHISFKVKLSIKKSKTCVKVFVIPFVFVY